MTLLADQVAVITGAGSGIGKALARALAAEGAALVLLGRRPEALETVRNEMRSLGAAARVCVADVRRDQDLRDLAAELKREPGRVDILVHNAGMIRPGRAAEAPVEEFDEHYRTNCRGPYLLTQLLLPLLRQARGQVVFINSSAALTARANVGQYAATKHALKALADSLRDEVNREGVRVLSVYCGQTATPMQEKLHHLERRAYRPERLLQPEDVALVVAQALALPRTAEVTDIHIRPMQAPGPD
jgi:NADP-dependent 3-hydroxy acid dehydrogenase YdfG